MNNEASMPLPEAKEPRVAPEIQAEYDQLAAALGDMEFKHMVRRAPMLGRMSDLNAEMGARLALEQPAAPAPEAPEVDPHAVGIEPPELVVEGVPV